MASLISLGSKHQQRIFVQKGNQEYLTPYWISDKGNLCWRINETVYVKLHNGFVMMLEEGQWIPGDAKTKATVAEL